MATTAKRVKDARKPKFKSRQHNRCQLCGRPRAFLRKFGVCRLCFRRSRSRARFRAS
jgi:small subunit ribosomal protein S14